MYVCAGRPAFAWPYVGVHTSHNFVLMYYELQGHETNLIIKVSIKFTF